MDFSSFFLLTFTMKFFHCVIVVKKFWTWKQERKYITSNTQSHMQSLTAYFLFGVL